MSNAKKPFTSSNSATVDTSPLEGPVKDVSVEKMRDRLRRFIKANTNG